ncbi:MAG: hypothetical protein ABSA40_03710 [Candidatus Dormibacteria bacterium]
MGSKNRSVSFTGKKLFLVISFVLFVIYVIGIFAGWSGNLDAALPWAAFAIWVLALLV